MVTDRVKKIQAYLKEHDIDAFLVLTKLNRQYISGFTGSAGMVLVTKKSAELYVDDRYTIRAKRESPLKVSKLSRFSATLFEIGEGRVKSGIGIEDKITVREFRSLKKNHRSVKWVVTPNLVENLRSIKSAREIKYIQKAAKIIDNIFLLVKKMGILGMTEIAIAQAIERLAVKLGADGMAFESIVAWGPNAAIPHHLPGKQKIKNSNFLLMDFGVLVNGYHSDFTRTLFIGHPDKQ